MEYLGAIFEQISSAVLDRIFFISVTRKKLFFSASISNFQDLNSDGSIDFEEFLYFSFILRWAHREDLFKFIFNLFDFDNSGKISKKGFTRMSKSLMQVVAPLC